MSKELELYEDFYNHEEEEDDFSMESTRPYSDFDEVVDDTLVKPLDFDISSTITAETFDDYSMLAETDLTYPYIVFEAQGNLNTVSGLCSGTLTKGDIQVYFRPSDDPDSLIPVVKIAINPINVRNLMRLAKKDTVYYRHTDESPERLALPEQFIRFINVEFKDSDEYWANLLDQEENPQVSKPTFVLEDLYS